MMRLSGANVGIALLCACLLAPMHGQAADADGNDVRTMVAQVVLPLMKRYGVPGMAVGVVLGGRREVFDYGIASTATGKPVGSGTLFELGSVSKTFAATLASYAQASGRLSLSDSASSHLPALHGSSFDAVSLVELGTHMSGGLPLQAPDGIATDDQLMAYFRHWKPIYAPGTYRTYGNPGIGLLGMVAARSMDGDYVALMQGRLFPALGMTDTYLDVPKARMNDYAQGYTEAGAPIRMTQGAGAAEAYGVRSTAGDMLRFVEANMGMPGLDATLQRAIIATHTGYYRVGAQAGGMTQDLVWEQYRYPVALTDLLAGNSARVALQANRAARIDPPLLPEDDVLINKTGSTNGFSAYVAFVPGRRIGIVLLANRFFPIDARVTAVFAILARLES